LRCNVRALCQGISLLRVRQGDGDSKKCAWGSQIAGRAWRI
jgi:hypothetical protein